jgi:hypothetical protein
MRWPHHLNPSPLNPLLLLSEDFLQAPSICSSISDRMPSLIALVWAIDAQQACAMAALEDYSK